MNARRPNPRTDLSSRPRTLTLFSEQRFRKEVLPVSESATFTRTYEGTNTRTHDDRGGTDPAPGRQDEVLTDDKGTSRLVPMSPRRQTTVRRTRGLRKGVRHLVPGEEETLPVLGMREVLTNNKLLLGGRRLMRRPVRLFYNLTSIKGYFFYTTEPHNKFLLVGNVFVEDSP